jgi:hypothetical protein
MVSGCLLVCLILAGVFYRSWLKIQYHRYRFSQAVAEYFDPEIGSSKVTWAEALLEDVPLVGRDRDHVNTVRKNYEHQMEVLIQLGYLGRSEFPVQHCVLTGDVQRAFYAQLRRTMPTNYFWLCRTSSNGTSVLVTSPTEEAKNWRQLVADFDKEQR